VAAAAAGVLLKTGVVDSIRQRFGWYSLPSNMNLAILPANVENAVDEDFAAMALGVSGLLASGLERLSRRPPLQLVPFMDTIQLNPVRPAEARELQGANLVLTSMLTRDKRDVHHRLSLVDAESGRRLRSREVEVSRSSVYEASRRTISTFSKRNFSDSTSDAEKLRVKKASASR